MASGENPRKPFGRIGSHPHPPSAGCGQPQRRPWPAGPRPQRGRGGDEQPLGGDGGRVLPWPRAQRLVAQPAQEPGPIDEVLVQRPRDREQGDEDEIEDVGHCGTS